MKSLTHRSVKSKALKSDRSGKNTRYSDDASNELSTSIVRQRDRVMEEERVREDTTDEESTQMD